MPVVGVLFAGIVAGIGAAVGSELAERVVLPRARQWLTKCEEAWKARRDDKAVEPIVNPQDEWVDRSDDKPNC